MDEQTTEQPEALNMPEMTVYEQLWMHLHAYHFGAIGFLELLDTFERLLHITSPQTNHDLG
jgi:hypothetical protein